VDNDQQEEVILEDDQQSDVAEMPEELSLKIVKRIVGECGGELLIRPLSHHNNEVFFWVPMELASTP